MTFLSDFTKMVLYKIRSAVTKHTKILLIIFSSALAVSTFALPPSPAFADEVKVSPILEKGIGQYKHENFEEALVTLREARREDPASTLAAYYLGLVYKQMQDFNNAITNLNDAVNKPPKIKGALIELIDCLYQMNRTDEAIGWVGEAEKEGIRPAQVAFLKGLLLSRQGKDEDAVEAFGHAKALDAAMGQSCDYQIGVIYLKTHKYRDAKRVFQQVVLVDPHSNMANFANAYKDAIDTRQEAQRPLKLSAGVAWQYDDNVVLMPDNSTLATAITDKADAREVYTGKAEYEYHFNDRFGLKGEYMGLVSKQNNLGFYDMVSNTVALTPNVYFPFGLLSMPTGYNWTSVNDKAYLSTPSTALVYSQMLGPSNMVQGLLKYQYKIYFWDPFIADEDRDGADFTGGVGWFIFFMKNKGFVNFRYAWDREWTKGCNWDYTGNRPTVMILMPLTDKLNATVTGDLYMQKFTNRNTVFNIYRQDKMATVSTLLAYKFYKDSEIQLQYTYSKDDSNIGVYKYQRNVFSAGVELKF